ncbi:MAG: hypothetical protein M3015_13200 [Bacteroidota bacterium]|nr:hypothetical protein [Bacteroidota bacterium]
MPGKFVVQFDLGADLTMFYGNTLKPYLDKYQFLSSKVINEDEYQWLTNTTISLNKILFKGKRIFIRKNYGDEMTADSVLTSTTKFIGTIGADFVQNKILIIDYKKNRLCIVDSLPKKISGNVKFIAYKSDSKGRVILPFEINDTTMNVMFDTGNSIFGFTSTKENWARFCDTSHITKFEKLNSWGRTVDVWESPLKSRLTIEGTGIEINNPKLSFLNPTPDGMNEFFVQSKISGLTGNVFFLGKCIIIDFKNEKFGILK